MDQATDHTTLVGETAVTSRNILNDHPQIKFQHFLAWTAFAVFSLGCAILRFYVGFQSDAWNAFWKLVQILGMMILLFLLEGLLVVVTQLKGHSRESLDQFIKEESLHGAQKEYAEYFFKIANSVEFDKFVDGRQILVVSIVAYILICADSLKTSKGFLLPLELPWLSAEHLNSVSAFLIAAVIPCWFAQLLPQRRAIDRMFGFSRNFLAKWLTQLSVKIGDIGVGVPSEVASRVLKRTFKYDHDDILKVSERQIFERRSAIEGMYIDCREVNLIASWRGTIIEEKLTYRLERPSVRHLWPSIRVFNPTNETFVDWSWNFPDCQNLAVIESVYRIQSTVLELEIPEDERSDPDDGVIHIASCKAELTPELPVVSSNGKFKPSTGAVTAMYEAAGLKFGPKQTDRLVVDVPSLTKKVHIILDVRGKVWLVQPELPTIALPIAYVNMPQGAPIQTAVNRRVWQNANGQWEIEVDFPPTGSQIVVIINGQPLARQGAAIAAQLAN